MLVTLDDSFLKRFSSEDRLYLLPKHLLKITFKILYVVDNVVKVSVWNHPAFKTKKGFMYYMNYGYHYSGEAVAYKADELAGVEFKLSRDLFSIDNINDFLSEEEVF